MYPNNYGFNPAMILDPITMSPMIRGGSITVNPLGVPDEFETRFIFLLRAQQKPWQKMFMKSIPQDMPNDLLQRILKVIGNLRSFKRSQKEKGKLLPFCHFEYETGEEVLRAQKFLNNIKILDRTLELKTSQQTQSFIKQWMTIQKQEWKKKLMATGMNEAKQYESLQKYLDRDDKAIAQRLANVITTVNSDYRRVLQERMREDERKEHPKEKQRDKRKKQFRQDLQRKYNQKLEFWLKREKQRDREYKKQKQREKQREKGKLRKLQRQIDLESDQQNRRITKFLNAQRKKFREKQLANDNQKIQLEWNPPEPAILIEPNAPQEPAPEQIQGEEVPKTRVFTVMQEQLTNTNQEDQNNKNKLIENNIQLLDIQTKKQEVLKPSSQFVMQQQAPQAPKKSINLNLPPLNAIEEMRKQQQQQKLKEQEMKKKLAQLFKLVPQNKEGLWNYQIDWDLLSKSVILEKKIRPWLANKSIEYLTQVQDKFITLIQKKLLSRSSPDKIVKILKNLLEQDAQEFVIKLWKQLIFEVIKLQNGII